MNLPFIQAALETAQRELGADAPFDDVLDRARQITGNEAFGGLLDEYDRKRGIRRVAAGEEVREDTMEALRARREGTEPTPWETLFEAALKLIEADPSLSEDEAFLRACEADPLSFQRWQDSLPKESTTPAANPETVTIRAAAIEDRAKRLVAAGEARDIDDALAKIFEADPQAYSDHLRPLS